MSRPSDAERAALAEAGPLLRFASEHVETLSPDLSFAISSALEAEHTQTWDAHTSQRFWAAFSTLCGLIKPVTMDCLAASERSLTARSWIRFWRRGYRYSEAERTSSRYIAALIAILLLITPLQLYVSTVTSLCAQLDDQIAANTAQLIQLSTSYNSYAKPDGVIKRTDAEFGQIERASDALQLDAQRIQNSATLLKDVASVWLDRSDDQAAVQSAAPVEPITFEEELRRDYAETNSKLQVAKLISLDAEQSAKLVSNILLSFVLPILFGTAGALAYVIRTISDQIRNTTFSASSPIRHLMRIMLGALMGAVIGLFNGMSDKISLSPLALAFLAGYGVEAVFSMFDGLIEKFRQPAASLSATQGH